MVAIFEHVSLTLKLLSKVTMDHSKNIIVTYYFEIEVELGVLQSSVQQKFPLLEFKATRIESKNS